MRLEGACVATQGADKHLTVTSIIILGTVHDSNADSKSEALAKSNGSTGLQVPIQREDVESESAGLGPTYTLRQQLRILGRLVIGAGLG